mmetsp:Transcript_109267/g.296298  ORF Transcript_109267/g.296298 Transcript_109267/m.296298 type:complete len:241 (-) Transcript_109267:192-914(-)
MQALCHAQGTYATCVAPEFAFTLLVVPKDNRQSVPLGERREMPKGNDRLCQPPVDRLELFEMAVPPPEWTVMLHLPLQFYAAPRAKAVDARQNLVRIGVAKHCCLTPSARQTSGLQQTGSNSLWAEPQAVVLPGGNCLRGYLAGAEVPGHVAVLASVVGHARGHSRHGEADFLVAVEHFQSAAPAPRKRVYVQEAPVPDLLISHAIEEFRPPGAIKLAPEIVCCWAHLQLMELCGHTAEA